MMKDMDKAVQRIQKALSANERILVYGDYDVDGITSVIIICRILNALGKKVDYVIDTILATWYYNSPQ